MTREELQELLAKHDQEFGKPEDPLAKWKREAKEQEERFARERAKARNLTDSEMAHWRAYFESLVAGERAATAELVQNEREFHGDVLACVIADLRQDIEAGMRQAFDGVRRQDDERLTELRTALGDLRLALNDIRERMAAAPPVAGPQGDVGPQGPQGPEGPPALFPQVKAWSADAISYRGDVVTHAGATWQAQRDTAKEPPHPDWIELAIPGLDGRDAVTPTVRGTWRADAEYRALDIVARDGGCFIAKCDAPSVCPGPDWQIVSTRGARGERGERGLKGEQGPAGPAAPTIVGWQIDRATFTATPIMSDGGEGPPLELRGLFEQYQSETR